MYRYVNLMLIALICTGVVSALDVDLESLTTEYTDFDRLLAYRF